MAPDSSKSTRDPASDWVINIGPGAGDEGGGIVAEGPPAQVRVTTMLTKNKRHTRSMLTCLAGDVLVEHRHRVAPLDMNGG